MPSLPVEMIVLLAPFAQLFADGVWLHTQVLVVGATLAPGKRTVSSCLRVMGLSGEAHFTNYHRVLNRAQWSTLQVGRIMLGLLVRAFVPPGAVIVLGADDTVERRSGRKIKAKGCYRDAVRSSKKHVVKCFDEVGDNDGVSPSPLGATRVGVALFDRPVLAAQVAPQASAQDQCGRSQADDAASAALAAAAAARLGGRWWVCPRWL